MFLTTQVTELDGCTVVALEGELDMSTADQLRDDLMTLIEVNKGHIVLDLGELRFCDSAGLAVFVKAHNHLDGAGRRLAVARPTPVVARILDLSGLAQVLPTAPSTDEACALVTET
jgi:anti-sigma B factor antagonist